ncbi:MAG TPA: hypothetical protein VJV78_33500 [Polyangiales bacterium]|nr:hypothetical protein [Polyangiales bacterium]
MRTWLLACVLLTASGCKGGCGSKTPVPFKRDPQAAAEAAAAPELPASGTQYGRLTREVTFGGSQLARNDGAFRVALEWDLASDGSPDLLVIATDERSQASLETWTKPASGAATKRAAITLTNLGAGCEVDQAGLSRLAPELVLGSLDVVCVEDAAPPAPQGDFLRGVGTPTPPDPQDQAPPPPGTQTHALHQFVINAAENEPRLLLHLAVMPPADPSDTNSITLTVASQDQDADAHADVLVTADIGAGGAEAKTASVPLLWLNRPSGLARDRAEPEHTLAGLAQAAFQNIDADPLAALPAAEQVLDAHRALCHESGAARVWVDESLGLQCGASAAAGRAAVVRALALAKQQQLLPALQARNRLSGPEYKVEPADRERVNVAIAAIRGQTSYLWERGPDLPQPTGPGVHLPAVAFLTEDQLLLRGVIAQTYDLNTRAVTPSAASPSVVMGGPGGSFAAVDLVKDCAGQYLRTVPASAIASGFVASTRGKDAALVPERAGTEGCADRTRRSDRSGWTVLGLSERGALLAKGSELQLVPLDAEGASAGAARILAADEAAPPLLAAGALAPSGLRHALATSEGIAIIDRGPKPASTLIRTPPSCTTRIGDVAISPSGQRFAMICAGHVYWAHATEPAAAPAAPAPQ